jgi:hypothetical protein
VSSSACTNWAIAGTRLPPAEASSVIARDSALCRCCPGARSVVTELVFGTQDARVTAPHGAFAHLAHAHLTVLPGIGHTPPWEVPDQVAELITAALPAGSQNK